MINFSDINQAALSNLESFVRSWFPDGRMRGVEWVCRNPHRNDNRIGSFSINTRTGVWKDFASGDGGSVPVSLLAFTRQIGQGEAARELASMFGIDAGSDWVPGPRPAPKSQPPEWTTTTKPEISRTAIKAWRGCGEVAGTIGQEYLRGRAISIDPGSSCRFHPDLGFWHDPIGRGGPWRLLDRGPALVLATHYGDDDDMVGVHRIYLTHDARKLVIPDPDNVGEYLNPKKAAGRYRGCHIRLGEWSDGIEIVASEGPENCLSLCQGLGLPGLCSISSGNLPIVRLPSSVKSVIVGADNDPAGRAAAEKAQISYAQQGASVRVIYPPDGLDWNDVARAEEGIVT